LPRRPNESRFCAQTITETDRWKTFKEYGLGAPNPGIPMAQFYGAFYGRGALQITWSGQLADYGDFRKFPEVTGTYVDSRITQTSLHYLEDPTRRDAHGHIIAIVGAPKKWAPRFDPDIVASDPLNACDSAGFFWVWKHHSGARNINRISDKDFSPEVLKRVNILVNGGGFGYFDRIAYQHYTRNILTDWVAPASTITVDSGKPHIQVQVDLSRPE
jgi:hypothetical protein